MLEILDHSRTRVADAERAGQRLFDKSLMLGADGAGGHMATIELSEEVSEDAGRPVAPPIWRPSSTTSEWERDINRPGHLAQQNTSPLQSAVEGYSTEVCSLPADNFSEGLLQDLFHQDLHWWEGE